MIFLQAFIHSIKLPNKKAMFQLNRIGMDITIVYLFILLFIVSVPSLIVRLTTSSGHGAEMGLLFLLIYFFIFYYLPLNIIVLVVLSALAYIGEVIAKLMQRKLRYSIIWKMTVYTATIPVFLYTFIALLFPVNNVILWFFLIYILIMIVFIISVYPKRKKRVK